MAFNFAKYESVKDGFSREKAVMIKLEQQWLFLSKTCLKSQYCRSSVNVDEMAQRKNTHRRVFSLREQSVQYCGAGKQRSAGRGARSSGRFEEVKVYAFATTSLRPVESHRSNPGRASN